MIEYDPHHWRSHLLDIRGSMVREIVYRVLSSVVIAIGVVYLHKHHFAFSFTPTAHTLIGVALGMLLVFRTNASYDRFWEGRKLWGAIVNDTRNFARLAHAVLDRHPDRRGRLLAWLRTMPWAIMHTLRGTRGLGSPTSELAQDSARQALEAEHVPLAVAARMSGELMESERAGELSEWTRLALDGHVKALIDHCGGCERIRKTPLPFAYVVHLRRALVLYCFSLPLALVDALGWETVPVVFGISYVLFGIEEIGVEIEDPFGDDDNDLPLEAMCAAIASNIDGLSKPGGSVQEH